MRSSTRDDDGTSPVEVESGPTDVIGGSERDEDEKERGEVRVG